MPSFLFCKLLSLGFLSFLLSSSLLSSYEIKKNTYVNLFNELAATIQPKARYSEAYGKLLDKALKDLGGRDELIAAAVYFDGQFKVENSWHSKNQKYRTIAQFLGSNANHMPRYQLCFEQSQASQPKTDTSSTQSWTPDDDAEWKEAMNNFRQGVEDVASN